MMPAPTMTTSAAISTSLPPSPNVGHTISSGVEERPGFAGALPSVGGLGAIRGPQVNQSGLGGHSGPPMSSIPPDHLTQRGAEILPHAFEVRMDRQRSPKALGGFAVLVERHVAEPLAGERPEV